MQACHILLSKSTKSKAHNFRYPVMNSYIQDFIMAYQACPLKLTMLDMVTKQAQHALDD